MTDTKAARRAPVGLGSDGRRLWRALVADFEFDPAELVLVEKAARTADDVARLEAALVDAPLTVAGSTGQTRPHPLLAELRAYRALLAALLRQLALPAEVDDEPARPRGYRLSRSEAGRLAARTRWGNR